MAQGCVTQPKSKDDVNELCHINVGGCRYEISKNVMLAVVGSRLHRLAHDKKQPCFFERPRAAFESILAYHQTGQLHMPGNLCPGAFKQEMEFWDVNPHVMENCCYHRYVTFVREQTILNGFLAKTLQAEEKLDALLSDRSTRTARLRSRMWSVLDNKDDSVVTKIYFCVATVFILMAIFATALGTLPHIAINSTSQIEVSNTTENGTLILPPDADTSNVRPNGAKGREKREMTPRRSFSIPAQEDGPMYMPEKQDEGSSVHISLANQPVHQYNDIEKDDYHGKQTDINRKFGNEFDVRKDGIEGTPIEYTYDLDERRRDPSMPRQMDNLKALSHDAMAMKDQLTRFANHRTYDSDNHHKINHEKHISDEYVVQGDEQRIDLQQEDLAKHKQGNCEQHQKEYLGQQLKQKDKRLYEDNQKYSQTKGKELDRQGKDVGSEIKTVLFSRLLEKHESDSFHDIAAKRDFSSATQNTFNDNLNIKITETENQPSHHIRQPRSANVNITGSVENVTENVENVLGNVTNATGYAANVTENVENVTGNVTNATGYAENLTEILTQVIINAALSSLNVTNDSSTITYPTGNISFNSSHWPHDSDANFTFDMDAGNDSFFNTNMSRMRVNLRGIFGTNIKSVKDVIDTILPETPYAKVLTIETAVDEEQLVYMYIEYATNIFFTVELFCRLICCPRATHYIFSFQNVIDMLVLAAVYIRSLVFLLDKEDYPSDIDILLYLQMLRVLRLLRLLENVTAYKVLCYTMKVGKKDIFLMLLYVFIGVLFFSNFIYFFERNEDFPSIPDSWWWSMVTMTTVGYGDMVPKTFIGKIIGSVCALSGVFMFSLIIPIFVNTFLSIYQYAEVHNRDTVLPRSIYIKKQNSLKVREQSV